MQAGNAEHFYADTGSFFWPAFATHLKGSQVRTHAAPDLSEASRKKKTPSGKETRETLKEMGFSDDGSSRSECQNECQNVSQHPLLMSIGSVLALLGFDPHPCQADSKSGTAPTVQLAHPTNCNLSQRMTFECATPAQRGIESLTDFADHTSKVYQSSVPQQFALSEASWCCMKLPGQSNKTLGKLWGVARASKAISCGTCPTAQLPLRLVGGSHLEIRHSAC